MSTIDELSRLLDDRGVEYKIVPASFYMRAYIMIGDTEILFNDRGEVAVHGITPAQAVEAILGKGTCRNLISRVKGQMPMLHCDGCGCTTTLNVPSGGAGYAGETEMLWPRFCSNCGREVRS